MNAALLAPPARRPAAAWLESGMNLDTEEFLRRYDLLPEVKKAELIEGVVFMGSPVRIEEHAEPDFILQNWLGTYAFATPGLQGAGNATVRLGPRNAPQPDALLRIRPGYGGQSANSDDGYVLGAPELVAEISASTRSLDLHGKKAAYERLGVREYLVWSVDDAEVLWFHRLDGAFARLAPEADGVVKSLVFPGLWLDVPALLRGDAAAGLARLQAGLATAEHRAFRDTLAARKAPAA
ncbi:MAG TPA: Uma2 family endonuclease [Verrucomicrobiota bacterium]|nr:Uma2 family endonuclease [Verrucomicrobiota bacterium]